MKYFKAFKKYIYITRAYRKFKKTNDLKHTKICLKQIRKVISDKKINFFLSQIATGEKKKLKITLFSVVLFKVI